MIDTGAWFNSDRTHRYGLWRIWDNSKPIAMFCGLNPSTANESEDDPTIRREIAFARYWGHGGIYMGNLYTQVTPDPAELVRERYSREAHDTFRSMLAKSYLFVACWGNFKGVFGQVAVIEALCQVMRRDMYCLGKNKNGSPRHPLYLSKTTPLEVYRAVILEDITE